MKVSVTMIARNEADTLPCALASVRGLADEVVIVDTGSTDDTVRIARELGAVVVEGGDRRHKAAMRNRAADVSAGDWIVVLDCDERIADPAGVRRTLEDSGADGVYIRLEYKDADDKTTMSFPQMRAWRRGAYRYRYRAHELPIETRAVKTAYTQHVWEHRPPIERNSWKPEHLLMLLLMDVDECPGEPRPVYYLGRQYMYIGAYRMAVNTLERYLSMSKRGEWGRSDAYGDIASCWQHMGDKDKAMDALMMAVQEQPNRRDWWGRLAEMHHEAKNFDVAAGMLRTLVDLPAHNEYINPYWYGAHPYDLLARCLWYAGRIEEGYPYAKRAAELSDAEYIQRNLRFFEEKCHA